MNLFEALLFGQSIIKIVIRVKYSGRILFPNLLHIEGRSISGPTPRVQWNQKLSQSRRSWGRWSQSGWVTHGLTLGDKKASDTHRNVHRDKLKKSLIFHRSYTLSLQPGGTNLWERNHILPDSCKSLPPSSLARDVIAYCPPFDVLTPERWPSSDSFHSELTAIIFRLTL